MIGDMTLRQFGYLAAGIIAAYIAYKFAPLPSLIRIPLAGILGLTGFSFAFLPIQERPLDRWVVAFIKSVISPTQYVWVKDNLPLDILIRPAEVHQQVITHSTHREIQKEANDKLRAYLSSLPKDFHESLNIREKKYIDATLSLFQTSAVFPNPPKIQAIPPVQPIPMPVVTPAVQKIEPSVNPQEEKPKTLPVEGEETGDFDKLHKNLADLAAEKKLLEQELNRLKQELISTKQPEVVKPKEAPEEKEPTIKTISPKKAAVEMGITNFDQNPNIITGVIKDPQKKILPNIILTIKDKNQTPLRALKTNKLGQFATATPLPNGIYFLEAEDPLKRYVFDIAEITLSGKVFLSIEITAKGEKELMREKLSKELFGGPII
ncbi:carboxypeptidase regulatory-like domain-containing protein [Candidatus Gottesmanbacteria bacterium]|nr:carboxypeptidase regulatory-like domain-containing protein [Candidatus Gottesmanbacteria bacterium]